MNKKRLEDYFYSFSMEELIDFADNELYCYSESMTTDKTELIDIMIETIEEMDEMYWPEIIIEILNN